MRLMCVTSVFVARDSGCLHVIGVLGLLKGRARSAFLAAPCYRPATPRATRTAGLPICHPLTLLLGP